MIWKLDRLCRSLYHLIEIVTLLEQQYIGLVSLNDPIATTTAQSRLVFCIFASLAEFEREVIRERTLAGLASARRQGQLLGRQKGLPKAAEQKPALPKASTKRTSIQSNTSPASYTSRKPRYISTSANKRLKKALQFKAQLPQLK